MISLEERASINEIVWELALWQFSCGLRVAAPGIVQSFDNATQTATVQIAIRENVVTNEAQGNGMPPLSGIKKTVAIAPLEMVPVVFPRSGGYSLLSPVKAGDECLLVFADTCIDAWWQSGNVQNQSRRRRHDLSDAFAIMGCWSQPRVLSGYPTDHMELRSDDEAVKLNLSESSVTVTTPADNPQSLVTNAFYQWVLKDLLPWAQSNGYKGVVPPSNSVTSVLEAE